MLASLSTGLGEVLEWYGDPNGIRTRVSAVKGRCPDRWTIGSVGSRGSCGGKGWVASFYFR